MTSFPRSLSCRPPSNQCVPPNDARASWLAFGNVARSGSHGRAAYWLALPSLKRVARAPAGGAVESPSHWPLSVAGWLRLSVPGRFPRQAPSAGAEEEGPDWGLTSSRCRHGLRAVETSGRRALRCPRSASRGRELAVAVCGSQPTAPLPRLPSTLPAPLRGEAEAG